MMRQSFINGEEWQHAYSEFERMEALSKQDVVNAATKYFGTDYVAVYRIDEQADLPVVAKPKIDPIQIDPSRQSLFASTVLSMPFDEIEPTFVEPEQDYRVIDFADGVSLYYAPNPLNDLFTFSVGIEVGTESNEKLSLAAALMDVAGTATMNNEALQKQWYRMGTQFNFGVGENSSGFSLSGLDDEFENSVDLMMEVIQTPTTDSQTLETLKGILIKSRQDRKNSPPAIAQALTLYNRYGEASPLLEAMPTAEIQATTLDELIALPAELLEYQQIIAYTGSKPLEEVLSILRQHYVLNEELKDTPPYRFRTAREVSESEVLVVDQKTAQAQVRIEFPDGEFSEQDSAIASAYTTYFGNGMSSIVFQELREARALAYSAYAAYSQGGRADAENLMIGSIGTQTDKTVDAVTAFLDLMENMPQSEPRFEESVNSLINRYRTSKLNFREVIGAVRGWERLELEGDPRRQRYEALQTMTLADLVQFQERHVQNKPKLISIVGDLSIIDVAELEQFGAVKQVQVSDLFVD
jgi:predicted Zn-dependent peptidase